MKRWFRPAAYTVILMLIALAVLGESPSVDPVHATVLPVQVARAPRLAKPQSTQSLETPAVRDRSDAAFTPALFAAAPRPAAPVVVLSAPMPAPQAPVAELKVLGWMQTESGPYAFVELGGESYTLTPGQIQEPYRFNKIGGGFAEFTHMPTGTTRQYAVRDPAVIE